jgi:hypothetical protein
MQKDQTLQSRPKLWPVRLGIPIGLTLLLISAFLGLIPGIATASADPGTLYVDGATGIDAGDCQNMAAPCQTIAYAIIQAVQYDDIWVTQGTYTENLVINKGVALWGGYESSDWVRDLDSYVTILDGDLSGSVVTFQGPSDGMVLDGFQVTGGNATSGGMGGGITIQESSPTIRNTLVFSNQVSADGGGIYVSGGMLIIEDSQVFTNTASGCCGGIHIGNNASATISNTLLSGNTASFGGALGVFSGSTITITNSTISGNNTDFEFGQGGGIHISDPNSSIHMMNSILADNQTRDHGAAISSDGGTVNLTNVLITGNHSSSQNANVFAIGNTHFNVMNSTIADNNPSGAQAVILWSGGLTMTNSIMWNNAYNIQLDPGCMDCADVTYSDIAGGWTGTGNIDQDPLFLNSEDYHLQITSPCINKGTLTGAPLMDLDGNRRDADPDMGAYEWIGSHIYLPMILNGGS